MHLLTIFREGAAPSKAELEDGIYPIGSGERCRIRLPDRAVAERHAVLTLSGGKAFVEDMGSELGVSVIVAPGCRHMAAGSIWGDKVQEEGVAAIESVSYTGTAQDLLTREELFTFETSPVAP